MGTDRYITAIQVCVTSKKIKGVKIWGARINNNGTLTQSPTPSEFSRTNCLGNWKNKVSSGSLKLTTGIRAYYTSTSKGFSGIALRCTKVVPR